MKNRSKWVYFFSQPHQPFFTFGIINAIALMILFIIAYKGFLPVDAKLFHSYGMIFMVFTNFFYGFTYTTFTKFSSQAPIPIKTYLWVFFINLLASISFISSIWIYPAFYIANLLIALSLSLTIRIFYSIYEKAPPPRADQYAIILAFGMGILSNLLFLLYSIPCKSCKKGVFESYGVEVGVYLYMILLASIIAFRMVPFFSRVMNYSKSKRFHLYLISGLLLHTILYSSYPKALFLADLGLAFIFLKELIRVSLPFPNPDPMLWGLHISLFWLPLGFFLGAIVEFFSVWFGYYSLQLPIHLLVLGFLTTILIAFGTRVTLGHGGAMPVADRWMKIILYFTQIVVIGRVVLSIEASRGELTPWFDISASLWIILILLWVFRYGKILLFGESR